MADIKLIGNDEKSWDSTFAPGYILFQKFKAIETGTLKSILVKSSGAVAVHVAVYSDSSGPSVLLSNSSGSTAVINGWNTISVSNIIITKDVYYWLACISSNEGVLRKSIGGTSKYKAATYSGFTWPNPPTGLTDYTTDEALAGWGELPPSGCPLQAMHMRRLM